MSLSLHISVAPGGGTDNSARMELLTTQQQGSQPPLLAGQLSDWEIKPEGERAWAYYCSPKQCSVCGVCWWGRWVALSQCLQIP